MKFIQPPYKNTKNHKYKDHTNCIINLDNVTAIESAREAYYPDNEGIPSIRFHTVGEQQIWYFDREDEKLRDTTIKKLCTEIE